MIGLIRKTFAALAALSLVTAGILLAGCGGGGSKLSSEVVSGTAAVGAPLAGKVSLKDSSTPSREKVADIDSNGAFAFDVSGMTAPYMLQANGSANGKQYKLHSYSEGTGTANINPLTDVIVASAAGTDDASEAYDKDDSDHRHKIRANIATTVETLLTKLQPLLERYGAHHTNPITSKYIANHLELDEMFDNVTITVTAGVLSIVNKDGAVIYTGKISDIANGVFNLGNVPPAAAIPAIPSGVTATGGAGQVTLNWAPVGNATSYNIYFATSPGVTTASGTKITVTANSYLQTGLGAGTNYYIVTALNSSGESAASTQVQAAVSATPPGPTVPSAPAGVTAAGGTKQVTISWPAVTGATSYNIYWSKTTGVTIANGTKLANATSPAVQGGLTDSTTYYYIVTAVNGVGESAPSTQTSAATLASVPVVTIPTAPTGVTAAGGANLVTVTWPVVTGATSYNIYYSTSTGVTKANGTKIVNATSPYKQTGLVDGTTYYIVVTAVNSAGESAVSTQVSAATSAAVVLDGLALYNQYCVGCHQTAKLGKTALAIQGAITANTGGMGSLSTLTTAQIAAIATTTAPVVTPPPACGSCHAIPPATGQHTFHIGQGYTCLTCHGTGYSSTTVNAATHNNGVKNVVTSLNWNGTSCSPACHGTRTW